MRLIDADAFIEKARSRIDMQDLYLPIHIKEMVLDEMPTVDAVPVRHGKWLDDGQYDNFFPHHEWRCSECGEHVLEIGIPWYKYCPNCGARMDTERKEE